jgi:glycosyltransferase involved in cell wall biosynthesis
MIRLFIHALAASAGGGLTYVRNVIPCLAARTDVQATVLTTAQLGAELSRWDNISLIAQDDVPGVLRRFWREQHSLPDLIRRANADVLLSAGNFALWNSPVPQILLSRNSIYTSSDFFHDLRQRGEYRMWLDTRIKGLLAKQSIRRAESTVAPSHAFADELRLWTGVAVKAIHHGFEHDAFFADSTPLPEVVRGKLQEAEGSLRLLFVSHYNYYRNFETLLRALPWLKQHLPGRRIRLLLTCRLRAEENPGSYRADAAAALVQNLGIRDEVVELGTIPYRQLHHVYKACDLYLTPAYTETFAHPLVEAMACGLPVIASDLPVHREICGGAATYFPRFSPQALAECVAGMAQSADRAHNASEKGLRRSRDFSWAKHVEQVVTLARQMKRG